MKKDWPYRFKTEKEFIKEYGSDWRYSVDFNWEGLMDYLCGTVLEVDYPDNINKVDIPSHILECHYWSISREMLTKNVPLVPNYKPRKIIREL